MVEARGLSGTNITEATSAGTHNRFSLQSVAAGGTLLEYVRVGPSGGAGRPALNIAPQLPFTTSPWNEVLSIGGEPLENILQFQERVANPAPQADLLGGTRLSGAILNTDSNELGDIYYSDIFVAAGSWFWVTVGDTTGQVLDVQIRWREFPEALGSP